MAHDGAWDAVEVSGPAAAAAELVRCLVERGLTSGAGVDALGGVVLVVRAGSRGLCTFLAEDPELLCGGG